jgi:hypothetical protein
MEDAEYTIFIKILGAWLCSGMGPVRIHYHLTEQCGGPATIQYHLTEQDVTILDLKHSPSPFH